MSMRTSRTRGITDEGFELVKEAQAQAGSPAAKAAHGEVLHLKGVPEPLLVLLDVDLTRPEMGFLGLKGTRLRICDFADPFAGEECWTEVTLDGGVRYRGEETPPPLRENLHRGTRTAGSRPIADLSL